MLVSCWVRSYHSALKIPVNHAILVVADHLLCPISEMLHASGIGADDVPLLRILGRTHVITRGYGR